MAADLRRAAWRAGRASRPDAGRARSTPRPTDLRRARRRRSAQDRGRARRGWRSGSGERVVLVADNSVAPPRRRRSRSGAPAPRSSRCTRRRRPPSWSTPSATPRPSLVVAGSRSCCRRRQPVGRGRRCRRARARRRGRLAGGPKRCASRRPSAGVDPDGVGAHLLHVRLHVAAEGGDALPRRPARRGARRTPRVWHLGADDVTLVVAAAGVGLRARDDVDGDAGGRRPGAAPAPAATRRRCCDGLRRPPRHVLRRRHDDVRQDGRGARAATPARPRPTSLRLCISGGEPRNDVAFARWQRVHRLPGARRLRGVRVLPARHLRPARGSRSPCPVRPDGWSPRRRCGWSATTARRAQPGQPGEAWARGPGADARLLAGPGADGGCPHRRRLVPHRRSGRDRPAGLRPRRRPAERRHHPRRRQRVAGRGRSGARRHPDVPRGGRRRPARPATTASRSSPPSCWRRRQA